MEVVTGRDIKSPSDSRDALDILIAQWRREIPGDSAEPLEVSGRIQYLGSVFEDSVSKVLKRFDLRYTDFDVIATLRRSGPPYTLTPTQLRKTVSITSGAMTAVLDRLEQAELIERTAGIADRRVKAATLTPEGAKLAEQAVTARFQEARKSIENLSIGEQKELAALLKKLIKSV